MPSFEEKNALMAQQSLDQMEIQRAQRYGYLFNVAEASRFALTPQSQRLGCKIDCPGALWVILFDGLGRQWSQDDIGVIQQQYMSLFHSDKDCMEN